MLAVVLFFGAIRWRLLDIPLERDEGEYAYAGQLILQGIPPYQLAYNMKLPGTYAAYAGILAVFGQTARGIHLGLLLVNSISIILLYVLTARLFGTLAGTIAGASFALLTTHQGVLGFAAHATQFVVLAALAGLILLLRAEETRRTVFFFWSGLAFGIAFLMKQPGILLGVFAFFYLAVACWPRNIRDSREWVPWAKTMGVFLLAAALPYVLTCALLYRSGVFPNFWLWTVDYARQYATIEPLNVGLGYLRSNFSYLLHYTLWLWVLALIGVSTPFWNPAVRRHAGFVFGLLAFSCAAVCPGFYFRQHYFVLMMPAVAILIAIAVTSAIERLSAHSIKSAARWLPVSPVIVFASVWALSIYSNSDFYFKLSPVEECRLLYKDHPFLEAPPIADYLRQHTAPTDTILVLGSEPEMYFYAHRHSATGYIYTYSLMEDQPYWPIMQKQMMQEVEASRPAYVVFLSNPYSWILRAGSPQVMAFLPWVSQYLSNGFEEVGVVETGGGESHYYWGEEALKQHRPGSEILIFKRKG